MVTSLVRLAQDFCKKVILRWVTLCMHRRLTLNGVLKDFLKEGDITD